MHFNGISVPLAPRLAFPELGQTGCAVFFAREEGSGFGGLVIIREPDAAASSCFLFMAERWDDATQRLLQRDVLSMPAGECFGAVMLADAVIRRLEGLKHLWCLTDSVAPARAGGLPTQRGFRTEVSRPAQYGIARFRVIRGKVPGESTLQIARRVVEERSGRVE
ncbi:MAG: hypothetical protein SGPRY_002327 [Prymnesium sp.]